jgi:hypothetical protein
VQRSTLPHKRACCELMCHNTSTSARSTPCNVLHTSIPLVVEMTHSSHPGLGSTHTAAVHNGLESNIAACQVKSSVGEERLHAKHAGASDMGTCKCLATLQASECFSTNEAYRRATSPHERVACSPLHACSSAATASTPPLHACS